MVIEFCEDHDWAPQEADQHVDSHAGPGSNIGPASTRLDLSQPKARRSLLLGPSLLPQDLQQLDASQQEPSPDLASIDTHNLMGHS